MSLWMRVSRFLPSRPLLGSMRPVTNAWFAVFREKHTIKTNKSVSKRFRKRGNGTLVRNKSGASHNTGYKARHRSNRLGQSTTITDKKHAKKMHQCMPK